MLFRSPVWDFFKLGAGAGVLGWKNGWNLWIAWVVNRGNRIAVQLRNELLYDNKATLKILLLKLKIVWYT